MATGDDKNLPASSLDTLRSRELWRSLKLFRNKDSVMCSYYIIMTDSGHNLLFVIGHFYSYLVPLKLGAPQVVIGPLWTKWYPLL